MKTLLLNFLTGILVLQSCNPSLYQPGPSVIIEEPIVNIYEKLSNNQNELYLKANGWMISVFKDARSIIQYSDKTEGTIIGKYLLYSNREYKSQFLYSNMMPDSEIYAKIDIRVKDNKARISIQPMDSWKYHKNPNFGIYYTKEQAISDMEELSKNFYDSLIIKSTDF